MSKDEIENDIPTANARNFVFKSDTLHDRASAILDAANVPAGPLAERVAALARERDELRDDLVDAIRGVLDETAGVPDAEGWRCSDAKIVACWAGRRLVELGVYEASPRNRVGSRVHWFRPIKAAENKQS